MAYINVTVYEPLSDGMEVKFRTPCSCSGITGVKVLHTNDDNTTSAKTFTFYDTHGNSIGSLGNLFASGVLVKVMLDTTKSRAYILNAGTNSYLEGKMGGDPTYRQATLTLSGSGNLAGSAYVKSVGDFVFISAMVDVSALTGRVCAFTISGGDFSAVGQHCLSLGSVRAITATHNGETINPTDVFPTFRALDNQLYVAFWFPEKGKYGDISVSFNVMCMKTPLVES